MTMIPPLPPPYNMLFAADYPHFFLTELPLPDLDELRWRLRDENPGAALRLIHGKRCHSQDGLYNEVSAALQLPLYFGRNWDALADILSDLPSWVQADQTCLIVTDADHVLVHDDDLPGVFWSIVREQIMGRGLALRVLLHLDRGDPAYDFRHGRFMKTLEKAGIDQWMAI